MSELPETATATATEDAPPSTTTAGDSINDNPNTDSAADTCDYADYDHLDDLDLPPLRIHATRQGDRLSASSLQIPPGIQSQLASQNKRYPVDSKMSSASPTGVGSVTSSVAASRRGSSRSRSPSIRSQQRTHHPDANSSFSSLEEFVDSDILYDKLGFVELSDQKQGYHSHHNSFSGDNTKFTNLTPLSERMSEDTLEDVHAFSDLSANTRPSSLASVGTGGSTVCGEVSSHVLEPLDEGDEDLESDDDADKLAEDGNGTAQVILTNLENITLQDHDHDASKLPATSSKTGADSPSLPTA